MGNGLNGFLEYVLSDVLWRKNNLSPEDARDELKAVYVKGRNFDLVDSLLRYFRSHPDLKGVSIFSASSDFSAPKDFLRHSYSIDADCLRKQFQADSNPQAS